MEIKAGPLLSQINLPEDLKKFSIEDLPKISDELRDFIVDVVSKKGGHFGASLGVVELTVALHYVFNTPYDQLVWDVGHQAYGHKILTGRRESFHTNRVYKGLSGFPKEKKVNTMLWELVIVAPLYLLLWACPLPVKSKVKQGGNISL